MCLFAVSRECTGTDVKFSFYTFANIVHGKRNLIAGCITTVACRHNVAILLICFILACCSFRPEMDLNCFCFEIIVFVSVVYDLLQCCEQIRSSVCIEWISVRRNFVAVMFKCGFSKNVLDVSVSGLSSTLYSSKSFPRRSYFGVSPPQREPASI